MSPFWTAVSAVREIARRIGLPDIYRLHRHGLGRRAAQNEKQMRSVEDCEGPRLMRRWRRRRLGQRIPLVGITDLRPIQVEARVALALLSRRHPPKATTVIL